MINKKFLILMSCLFLSSIIWSQPTTVTISNCDNPTYNSNYISSGIIVGGAICYISDTDPTKTLEIDATNGMWIFGSYLTALPNQTPCVNLPAGSNEYANDTNPDITQVTPSGSMCGIQVSAVAFVSIPTLGQWGLITLFILLIIMGVLTLQQPIYSVYRKK